MAMTVSIIIPTLNEERTVMATLAHTATLGFDELVVVDGGSTDETPSLVNSYRQSAQSSALCPVQWVTSPPGRARQMNEGAKASRGEILLFLHADTQLPGDAKTIIDMTLADRRMVGGRFDVRCPIRSPIDVGNHHQQDDELEIETERPRHRRSSPVRASLYLRTDGRLCRHAADGGY